MIWYKTQHFSMSLPCHVILILSFSSLYFPKAINQGRNAFLSEAPAQFGEVQRNNILRTI